MNKLTVGLSGRKQAGKTSGCLAILCYYVNRKIGENRLYIKKVDKKIKVFDAFNNDKEINFETPNPEATAVFDTFSVKIFSFADYLKRISVDVLGIPEEHIYGTNDQKNSKTNIDWDTIPLEIAQQYMKKRRGVGGLNVPLNSLTAREVLQVLGTNIFRKMDPACWSRATYGLIEKSNYSLNLIGDARFKNEISMGTEIGAKMIRLLRKVDDDQHESENDLEDFPLGEYSLVVDNQNLSLEETNKILIKNVELWLNEKGI